jgi:hypothetical protein
LTSRMVTGVRTLVAGIGIVAALGAMAVIVVLGWRLWMQVRRLGRAVSVAADDVARSSDRIASLLSGRSESNRVTNSEQDRIGQ